MRPLAVLLAAAALLLAGCRPQQPTAPAPSVHAVLGEPYLADGLWNYPRPQPDLDETGLAVPTTRADGLTADGEAADPSALAAAHPTLPLPSLVRVTNIDTGLQVLVRVNDRGPGKRGRVIALTPRAIQLLGAPAGGVLRVRVQIMAAETQQMQAALQGAEAPALPIATAPAGEVGTEALPPPPGIKLAATRAVRTGPTPRQVAHGDLAAAPVPLRLPEQVFQVAPRGGLLYVELGTFSRLPAADEMRRRFARLGAQAATSYDAPRDRAFSVRIGPFFDVPSADAALTRALAAGVEGPRIVIN